MVAQRLRMVCGELGAVGLVSVAFVVLIVVCAIFAPEVAPHSPYATHILLANRPPGTVVPSGSFLLGTDGVGRDELSRLIYGARVSLSVGALSVLLSGLFGITVGLIAGYYRGAADALLMRCVDVQLALPSLLIALFVLYIVGSDVTNVILVLAVTRWPIYARLVRGQMLSLRERQFFEALGQLGLSDRRIILRHAAPNVASAALTLAVLEMANMILIEASLDFLGLGVQPPTASWGLMLSDGVQYIQSAWWLVTIPGVLIALTALSFVLIGNQLGRASGVSTTSLEASIRGTVTAQSALETPQTPTPAP